MKLEIKNIFSANARVIELKGELEQLKSEVLKLTESAKADAEKIADYQATIAAFPVADYEKTINDMKELHLNEIVKLSEEHEESLMKLSDELEAAKSATSKTAANIVASIGIRDDVIPAEPKNEMTPEEALKHLQTLQSNGKNKEAALFHKNHPELFPNKK